MASTIYGVAVDDVTKDQRFVGKTTILGAGYGMGAVKFQAQLKTFGFDMPLDEARRVINIYRDANWNISNLWKEAQVMLRYMAQGDKVTFGKSGVIGVDPANKALIMPSGLPMYYSGLFAVEEEKGPQYYYKVRRGDNKIYGGKVVENVCQAIARCIIGEQMLRIAKRYKVVLTVHDSIVCCVPDAETDAAKAYIEDSMRWVPDWAAGLPVDCEAGTAKSYGECE
jgi:DNA polymerase